MAMTFASTADISAGAHGPVGRPRWGAAGGGGGGSHPPPGRTNGGSNSPAASNHAAGDNPCGALVAVAQPTRATGLRGARRRRRLRPGGPSRPLPRQSRTASRPQPAAPPPQPSPSSAGGQQGGGRGEPLAAQHVILRPKRSSNWRSCGAVAGQEVLAPTRTPFPAACQLAGSRAQQIPPPTRPRPRPAHI